MLGKPTRAQTLGWTPIEDGKSTLLLAPTGSGKTLAAFLVAIDRLLFEAKAPVARPKGKGKRKPQPEGSVRVLYISPLKALAVDVDKNLRGPLAGIVEEATRDGVPVQTPTVGVRTGDTSSSDRARMLRHPPDILITTPESLYLLLTSRAREILAGVETVIVDEIHAISGTKRGAHLFLSLERLERLRAERHPKAAALQRIGLSATQRPLEEIARLLGGYEKRRPRSVTIVDASEPKRLSVRVIAPKPEPIETAEAPPSEDAKAKPRASIWPRVHQELLELIGQHRSTMVFVNSRRLAEKLATALNDLAGREVALAHHGSVARETRLEIEDRLKSGKLPAIVATSSLELGIDMGAVDLVVQIEAPPSIASGLQRVGRAGHSVGAQSTGVLIPKHRADLLSCAAAIELMSRLEVEETVVPRSPLDVLAQQIVATLAVTDGPMRVDALFELVRSAAPFHDLPRRSFEGVLDMLSGRYPSERFAALKARIVWDRIGGTVRAREGAGKLAIGSGGTIPDRGLYGVYLRESEGGRGQRGGKRVGELDEEMVFELREGEVFLLGASTWRAEEIGVDRVIVSPAPGEPGKMPFWHGDRPGRSRAFGEAIGKVTRNAAESPDAARADLVENGGLDAQSASDLVTFVADQVAATGEVPSDRVIVIERFVDDVGDHRVCILTPFGARVHAPWATAVLARLRETRGDVDVIWSDDGIAFRLTKTPDTPPIDLFLPNSDQIEERVRAALPTSAVFAARFREAAGRALLLPRGQPGKRTPLWAQRRRASDLLTVAAEFPTFPILLEAYRECLREVFDLPGLVAILHAIETRAMRVVTVDTRKPSPFASSVLFSFLANVIYEGDTPMAERRAQALAIDHDELRELLGEEELRNLLDPEVIAEHAQLLQRRDRRARGADALVDLLLWLGDLATPELEARFEAIPVTGANLEKELRALEHARRIVPLVIAGERRFVAAEDAARYRDALGVRLPSGLPAALLEPANDPLVELVGRYARTHGPFTAAAVAARFGLGEGPIKTALAELAERGRLNVGAFTTSVEGQEYCDAEVLTALRRKSLAKLRKQIEPASGDAFARFLLAWQSIGERRRSPEALIAVIGQIEGCPIPASVLEREVLPARVEGFEPWDLDSLCAAGEIVWAGVESLGADDGRIVLYLSDHEAALSATPNPAEGELAASIRALMERRGALFFHEIAREVGRFPNELADALWAMVWAGEVSSDTLEPLRSRLAPKNDRVDPRRPRPRGGPPGTEGRWSLRSARLASAQATSDTERRMAVARALLDRYGVVTGSAVQSEGIANGFAAVYEIYRTMEDSGRVRRGYFIAGQGGAQFALPGAEERLRSKLQDERLRTIVLAATDPANPYGSILPWPEVAEGRARPGRQAGARVVLADGRLVGWIGRTAESLLTFLPDDEPERTTFARALAEAIGSLAGQGGRRVILLQNIDGEPARASAFGPILTAAGFQLVADGYVKRRTLEEPYN
jgi:ATP-dependent Lhr-like helicase